MRLSLREHIATYGAETPPRPRRREMGCIVGQTNMSRTFPFVKDF
jgi:hypothetical protein